MTDALDHEIEEKRKALSALDDARLKLEIELNALLRAAKLRPFSASARALRNATSAPPSEESFERRGGKPPGAISPKWRDVLSDAYSEGGKRKFFEYFQYASQRNLKTNITAIRDRVRAWEKMGFLSGTPEVGFEVTDAAAARFGFKRKQAGIDLFGEEEAPTSEPMEAP